MCVCVCVFVYVCEQKVIQGQSFKQSLTCSNSEFSFS